MSQPIAAKRFAPMLHLLWKELQQVQALAIALLVLGTLIYLLLWLWGSTSYDAVLVLLPNLFALGAPVLMIGHEEETGTLAWSRTLPIGWRSTLISKWLVAVVGLAMAWGVSFFFYQFTPQARVFANSMNLMSSPAYLLTFSLTLLACGFMLSWWLRKPIATLFALIALMSLVYVGSFVLSEYLWGYRFSQVNRIVPLLAVAGAVMAVASVFFARRTWTQPWSRKSRLPARTGTPVVRPYRPTEVVPLMSPGVRLALLWQHARQSLPITMPAFVVGVLAAMFPLLGQRFYGLAVFLPVVAVLMLGVATFLTDNSGGRHRFLAERGFSAWTIWWTRQALPLLMAAVIMALAMISWELSGEVRQPQFRSAMAGLLAALGAAFMAGQLTAMVVQRPTLALLSAPLTLVAMLFLTSPILEIYDGFPFGMLAMFCLGLPVLWLATLRLCRRWLDDQRTVGFYSRAVGWVAAAVLVAFGSVVVQRWITTPAAMPEWKRQVLAKAAALPAVPLRAKNLRIMDSEMVNNQSGWLVETCQAINQSDNAVFSVKTAERIRLYFQNLPGQGALFPEPPSAEQQTADQLAADQLAAEQQTNELYADLIEATFRSLERYRQHGELRYSDLADAIEAQLVGELASPRARHRLSPQAWAAYVERLATAEQRREARRRALLRSYQSYAGPRRSFATLGYGSDIDSRLLGGYWVIGERRHILAGERYRTRRLVDRAVRLSLEDLDRTSATETETERWDAWQDVWEVPSHINSAIPTMYWDRNLDASVRALKAQRE